MYAPFNHPSAATQAIGQAVGNAQPGEDGLTLAPPQKILFSDVSLPVRLHDKLLSIRLLSSIPLSYLVPDADLLPPEWITLSF